MTVKDKSVKKKVIISLIIVCAVLLLIGSFFIRDIALRAGLDEYEQKEIVLVQSKYIRSFEAIEKASATTSQFSIICNHKGIFEKSEIIPDENGTEIYNDASEHIDVLCHTYCHGIYKRDGILYFQFNKSGSKLIVYSSEHPQKDSEKDVVEKLSENWYYIEHK